MNCYFQEAEHKQRSPVKTCFDEYDTIRALSINSIEFQLKEIIAAAI